jgi:CheY-like chemotaxis protein
MGEKKICVLVVDDEPDFRELMTFWLSSRGYSVITASDGPHGIEMVKKKKPDIVFMDLRMPGMDGIEAIDGIRKFDKDVPIIIISAYIDDPKAIEANAHGISGMFYKGKDFKEGLSLLESVLRRHKQLSK